jgi:hypothetical protein
MQSYCKLLAYRLPLVFFQTDVAMPPKDINPFILDIVQQCIEAIPCHAKGSVKLT